MAPPRTLLPLAVCSGAALALYGYATREDSDDDVAARAARPGLVPAQEPAWLSALAGVASACVGAVSARTSAIEHEEEGGPRGPAVAAAMWTIAASLLDAEPDARMRLPGVGYEALARSCGRAATATAAGDDRAAAAATRALGALLRGSLERRHEVVGVDGVAEVLLRSTVPRTGAARLDAARDALRRAILGAEGDDSATRWRRQAKDRVRVDGASRQRETADAIERRLAGVPRAHGAAPPPADGDDGDLASAAVAAWLILAWSRRHVSPSGHTADGAAPTHVANDNKLWLSDVYAPEPLRRRANGVSRALVARLRRVLEEEEEQEQEDAAHARRQWRLLRSGYAELMAAAAAEMARHVTDEGVAEDLLAVAASVAAAATRAGDDVVMEPACTLLERAARVARAGHMSALAQLSSLVLPRVDTLSAQSQRALFASVAACTNAALRQRDDDDNDNASSSTSCRGNQHRSLFPERGAELWGAALAKAASRSVDADARHAASRALAKVVEAAGDEGPRVLAEWVRAVIRAVVGESAAANREREDVGEERQQIEGVVLTAVKRMEDQVLLPRAKSMSPVAAIGGVGAILPLATPQIAPGGGVGADDAGGHDAPSDTDASRRLLESSGDAQDHGRAIARSLRPLSVLISSDASLQRMLVDSMELLPLLQALVSYKWPTLDEELATSRVVSRLLAIIAVRQSGARALDFTPRSPGASGAADMSGTTGDDDTVRWDWRTWLEHIATESRDRKLRSHARRALLNAEAVMANARSAGKEQRFRFAVYQDGIHLMEPSDRRHRLLPLGGQPRDGTEGAPSTVESPPMFDIVFVHGLLGRPFQSWRIDKGSTGAPADGDDDGSKKSFVGSAAVGGAGLSSAEKVLQETYWPAEWLQADVPSARMLSVSYKTNFSQWEGPSHDLTVLSKTLLPALRAAGVGDRPVVFVTHSLGGLLVKQMLCDASDDRVSSVMDVTATGTTATGTTAITTASNKVSVRSIPRMTKGIMFYSCPHFGSPLVRYLVPGIHQLMLPSAHLLDLRYESPHLSLLNAKLSRLCRSFDIAVVSLAEGSLTPLTEVWEGSGVNISVDIVPPESSYPGFGDFHQLKGITHVNTCKPTSKESDAYTLLIQLLRKSHVI